VPSPSAGLWELVGFEEAIDRWIEREQPSIDVQFVVGEWVLSRFDDPYSGMQREASFPNLWYGAVPDTEFKGQVVVCSYFVEEREHRVKCDSFATLGLPI
jgi:hypothetical protein